MRVVVIVAVDEARGRYSMDKRCILVNKCNMSVGYGDIVTFIGIIDGKLIDKSN